MKKYVCEALKQMAEIIAREKFSPNIPLRAEGMGYEEIEKLIPTLKYSNIILKYVSSPSSEIVEVVGPRGAGKTTNILASFMTLNERDVFASGIYFDVLSGEIKVFDPRSYISKEELEEKGFINKNQKELINEAKVVAIDNWHYVSDLTTDEKTKEIGEKIIDELAERTLEELNKDKKIIISTEEYLKYYKDFTDSENFKELVDYPRIIIEISPPEFEKLCSVYNVKVDEKIKSMWNLYSDFSARSFVNMINKFGRKSNGIIEVKWEYVINKCRKKIDESLGKLINDKYLLKFVLDNPKIKSPKTVKYILGGKYEIEYWKEELKEVEKDLLGTSEKLRKIENKEKIKEYFRIKEKLKKIKNEKSGAYRKFIKTGDTSYLIKTGEYDLKIRELENRLKNIEITSTFEEYKKIKSEYNRLSLKKRKIENAINILSKPPYNLKGEKLKERINTLLKVYDDKGQLRIDPLREEFLNAINVSSYFNEILLKVFPELSDYR